MHDVQAEHRRSRRLTLAMPGRCRNLHGFGEDVVIRDISAHGCRVISHGIAIRAGDRIVVRPTGMEGLAGEVRWVSAHQAGIEFERPLYEPVVEHLHRLYASFLPPEVPWQGTVRRLAA